jgi:hypothetical protein
MMDLPIREMLEVVHAGVGFWDTRAIDLNLGLRGVAVKHGILPDLRELERMGLIRATEGGPKSTGPHWSLTEAGILWLAEHI